jgi:hypothetical protein
MWEEQYERMQRALREVERYYEGLSGSRTYDVDDFQRFRDAVIHFFQDCFHLRDWLKNDPSVSIPDQDLFDLFNVRSPSRHLPVSRDVANGSKHLRIDRPSVSRDAKVAPSGRLDWTPGSTMPEGVIRHSITVQIHATKVMDALELAKVCVKDWNAFLRSKRLI